MNIINYIVIGTDCSGKTSLVNLLSDVLGYEVIRGSSFESAKCEQHELFTKFMDFTDMKNVVFDRFTYCNYCYATLYEDYAKLSHGQRRVIELEMMNKATIIYLYADDKVLAERFNSRGDDYVDLENLIKAKRLYEEELENIKHLQVVKYDTGKMNTKEIVADILLNY